MRVLSIMSSESCGFDNVVGVGLDIRLLWENSKSVVPPHHLNFFNPSSLKRLAEATGFECLQVSTPGELDIDIIYNNRSLIQDRFWTTLLEMTTPTDGSSGSSGSLSKATAHTCGLFVKSHDAIGVYENACAHSCRWCVFY